MFRDEQKIFSQQFVSIVMISRMWFKQITVPFPLKPTKIGLLRAIFFTRVALLDFPNVSDNEISNFALAL